MCICVLFFSFNSFSQTSWKGTTSTIWKIATNLTNGVATASVDAIIGDANFTGSFQPSITASSGSCKALTIGGGTKASTLTVTQTFTIAGTLTINNNGTITHSGSTLTIQGNWTNSGTYNASNSSAIVNFGGTTQTLGGRLFRGYVFR